MIDNNAADKGKPIIQGGIKTGVGRVCVEFGGEQFRRQGGGGRKDVGWEKAVLWFLRTGSFLFSYQSASFFFLEHPFFGLGGFRGLGGFKTI